MRFSEIGSAVPNLSDRLLSERMKELEARGIVERHVAATGSPVRVEYALTAHGRALAPALRRAQGVGATAGWARPRTAGPPRHGRPLGSPPPAPPGQTMPQHADEVKALVEERGIRFIRLLVHGHPRAS